MSIGADAALLDIRAHAAERADDPQRVQRRLARGLCGRCGHPVAAEKGKRRSPLCDGCWHEYGWCSPGQHAAPRGEFHAAHGRPRGIGHCCKACKAAAVDRKAPPPCGRCGEPVSVSGTARRRLCDGCLRTHAWCCLCGPLPRRAFPAAVRRHAKHADTCTACRTARRRARGAAPAKAVSPRNLRAAVAEALAHPERSLRAIAAAHGFARPVLSDALIAAGQPRRPRATVAERYALARELGNAELAARLGITVKAARNLRSRARRQEAARGEP